MQIKIEDLERNAFVFSFEEVNVGDEITYYDTHLFQNLACDLDICQMQMAEITRRQQELNCTLLLQKCADGRRILSFV